MFENHRVLAVVPARSGSKGIPHKNMREIHGVSLIGWAGKVLAQVPFLDGRIISTDSAEYAAEGRRHGLDAPFLRPEALSGDRAGAIETMQHALLEAERYWETRFDVVLIVEPTSPLRKPEDIIRTTQRLVESGADSVVTVSPLPTKFHPYKLLTGQGGRLGFFASEGKTVTGRQQLQGEYYYRNGLCYAMTRSCLMEEGAIFTDRTLAEVTSREVVNIDDPIELDWATFLVDRHIGSR